MLPYERVFELSDHEYAPYFGTYLAFSRKWSIAEALQNGSVENERVLDAVNEENGSFAYAPGKWSVKQSILHCMDTERVFAYRALRFMRADETDLPGYDHEAFVLASRANDRSVESLREEWACVRAATEVLFSNATEMELSRSGTANGYAASARALGLVLVGHSLHHFSILRDRYGVRF